MILHLLADEVGNLLVEPPEENGAHHDSAVEANAPQESCTLEGDVGGTHQECLARTVGQREQVVRSDAKLFSARDVGVTRAAANGNNKVAGCNLRDFAFFVDSLEIYKLQFCLF